MKLYTATILGRKFYFTGQLTTEATKAAEHFCVQLDSDANNSDPKKLFMLLLNHFEANLDCLVAPVNVEHIFRINF